MTQLNAFLLEHEEVKSTKSILMTNHEYTCMVISMAKSGEQLFIQENKALCLAEETRL